MATEAIEIGQAPTQIGVGDAIPDGLLLPAGVPGATPGGGTAADISVAAVVEKAKSDLKDPAGGLTIDSIAELRGSLASTALNILPDWGRLTDSSYMFRATRGISAYAVNGSGAFLRNSATIRLANFGPVTGLKFTDNAVVNGGAVDVDEPPEVTSLLTKMISFKSTMSRRYKPEFYLADTTSVSSPAYETSQIAGYYLATDSGWVSGVGGTFTSAYWIYTENDADVAIISTGAQPVHVDGVLVDQPAVLASGWSHVCVQATNSYGYVNSIYGVYVKPSVRVVQGLHSLFRGRVVIKPNEHLYPLAGIPYI